MTTTVERNPFPDLLARRDVGEGPWGITKVPMEPGHAKTSVTGKEMYVPVGDTPQERAVRAHEMMHAKCSPAESWQTWIKRGFASSEALISAEEFRINTLCSRAGFDMKRALTDGSEKASGERVASQELWAEGVYLTAAFAGTARLNPFIAGVRKHNPAWAESFKAVAKRLDRIAKRVKRTDRLASTAVDIESKLAPYGFTYTESWAMLLDQIAKPIVPEDEDTPPGRSEEKKDGTPPPPPVTPEEIKDSEPVSVGAGSRWDDLRIERCPMPRLVPGGLGRKRQASDHGRSPRRIHRILTDPQRRVFDKKKRSNGGVVLIDGSGSMSLSETDVLNIMAAAPGATVAIYSSYGNVEVPNLYIIGDKGKMVSEVPPGNIGNGVDGPAAEWAVKARQHPTAPVVWVTDGFVHGIGTNTSCSEALFMDCLNRAVKNRIVCVPDVGGAILALQAIKSGKKPRKWVPSPWSEAYRKTTGRSLVL
jgi:hypothetical protein